MSADALDVTLTVACPCVWDGGGFILLSHCNCTPTVCRSCWYWSLPLSYCVYLIIFLFYVVLFFHRVILLCFLLFMWRDSVLKEPPSPPFFLSQTSWNLFVFLRWTQLSISQCKLCFGKPKFKSSWWLLLPKSSPASFYVVWLSGSDSAVFKWLKIRLQSNFMLDFNCHVFVC